MMDQLVSQFADQLREALKIGRAATIRPSAQPLYKAYVAGMGGSGIGANFVAEFISGECPLPYQTGKGYGLPAHIDAHTLAICSSYSGNTEETLSAFEKMLSSGAKIVCIASGGKLLEMAKAHDLDYIELPGGSPSPRACLGYSLVAQLCLLEKLGLISPKRLEEVAQAADLIDQEEEDIRNRAENIAQFLQDKIPVIYTTDRMEAVAVRFRQQLNENAKMLAWHHVIPEMNHNELVGWRQEYSQLTVVYLRNKDDLPRNQLRIDINKEIIGNYTGAIIELYSKGLSLIERALYLVHLTDWVSVYLAEVRGKDAVEIKVIDYLKSELGKVKG